jgi:hypothetical protein
MATENHRRGRGCAACGELIGAGSQFCGRCGARLVSSAPDRAGTSTAGVPARSRRAFSPARTGAILGGLFVLGALAALAHQALSTSSNSSTGHLGMGNLAASQDFRLPDASSDFIGEWCGWSHVSSCDPPGSCNNDESLPNSMNFTSDAGWFWNNSHSVTLQYTILTAPGTQVENIQVHALDPRDVQVTYVARRSSADGSDYTVRKREDIVSVGPASVRETDHLLFDRDGTEVSEELSAELTKCSDEFLDTETKYIEQNKMVENVEVTGQVPSK